MGWFVSGHICPVGGNNLEVTVLASAERTATTDGPDMTNRGARGVMVTLDVTAITDTPSLVLKIQAKDPVSEKYETLLEAAAVTATGTHSFVVYPGVTATDDVVEASSLVLPQTWRVRVEAADADAATYSIGGCYLP